MKRIVGLPGALAVLLAAAPAAAQMVGNPVYVPVGMGTGVNIAGDFGLGLNDASAKTKYFGARATLALPFFYVTAGVGSVKPSDDLVPGAESEMTYGGNVGFKVLNLPMMPVKVAAQAGAGYLKSGDYKQLDIPVALALGLSFPMVPVKPWIAPRLHVRYADDAGVSDTEVRFGGSIGLNATFGLLGVHAALDYIKFPESDTSPLIFGAGASVGLSLPGL
jgi:ABC-type amino acid transport substrate-binding protein